MAFTGNTHTANILIFGFLRRHMDKQGLPYAVEKEIAPEGEVALDIAEEIGLPPNEIEAVFVNGRVINIHDRIFAGDRVAFSPYGTPGPYRVFLGMARENAKRAHLEKEGFRGEKEK